MNTKKINSKTIFILSSIFATIVIVISLLFFTTRNSVRITKQNKEYLVDNANHIAEDIDQALSDGYDNIKILSELVSSSLNSANFDITSIQDLIKNSVFDFMEFADKDGWDHNITGGVSDAKDRQYYLDAKNGNTGMELIYVSRATHETLLMFYSPIYYNNTEFVGSLVGVYQAVNRITNLLSTEYFGEMAPSYYADKTGRIIASNMGINLSNGMFINEITNFDSILPTSDLQTFDVLNNKTGGVTKKLEINGGYLI